jgi:hypothetical protein
MVHTAEDGKRQEFARDVEDDDHASGDEISMMPKGV